MTDTSQIIINREPGMNMLGLTDVCDINPSYRKFTMSLDYDVCYIDFLIKEAIEICGDQPVKDLLNLSDR